MRKDKYAKVESLHGTLERDYAWWLSMHPKYQQRTKIPLERHRTESNNELGVKCFRCDGRLPLLKRQCNYYIETISWLYPSCLAHLFHKASFICPQTQNFLLQNPLHDWNKLLPPSLIYSQKWLVLLHIFTGPCWLLKTHSKMRWQHKRFNLWYMKHKEMAKMPNFFSLLAHNYILPK